MAAPAQKKRLPKDQVTFIRKNGRVIPIKKKPGYDNKKKAGAGGGGKGVGSGRRGKSRSNTIARGVAASVGLRSKIWGAKKEARKKIGSASVFLGGVAGAIGGVAALSKLTPGRNLLSGAFLGGLAGAAAGEKIRNKRRENFVQKKLRNDKNVSRLTKQYKKAAREYKKR